MPGRHTRHLLVAAVSAVALVAAALTVRHVMTGGSSGLGPKDYDDTTGTTLRVGEQDTYFAGDFGPHGADPIHVTAVRLTGVPDGIRVVGIWALDEGPPGGAGALNDATRKRLRPITDMVFHPALRRPTSREEWGLVITLEAVKPGTWITTGIDISWKAGGHRGTTHYNHRYKLDVTP